MKYTYAFLLLVAIASGCQEKKVQIKTEQVVIYDTLPDPQVGIRQKYDLPQDYKIIPEGQKWLAVFHFSEANRDAYLSYDDGIVWIWWTITYAQRFDRPRDAVAVIKKHWSDVLKDRASHLHN